MSAHQTGPARYVPAPQSSALVLLEHALAIDCTAADRVTLLAGALGAIELSIGTEAFAEAIMAATSRSAAVR